LNSKRAPLAPPGSPPEKGGRSLPKPVANGGSSTQRPSGTKPRPPTTPKKLERLVPPKTPSNFDVVWASRPLPSCQRPPHAAPPGLLPPRRRGRVWPPAKTLFFPSRLLPPPGPGPGRGGDAARKDEANLYPLHRLGPRKPSASPPRPGREKQKYRLLDSCLATPLGFVGRKSPPRFAVGRAYCRSRPASRPPYSVSAGGPLRLRLAGTLAPGPPARPIRGAPGIGFRAAYSTLPISERAALIIKPPHKPISTNAPQYRRCDFAGAYSICGPLALVPIKSQRKIFRPARRFFRKTAVVMTFSPPVFSAASLPLAKKRVPGEYHNKC